MRKSEIKALNRLWKQGRPIFLHTQYGDFTFIPPKSEEERNASLLLPTKTREKFRNTYYKLTAGTRCLYADSHPNQTAWSLLQATLSEMKRDFPSPYWRREKIPVGILGYSPSTLHTEEIQFDVHRTLEEATREYVEDIRLSVAVEAARKAADLERQKNMDALRAKLRETHAADLTRLNNLRRYMGTGGNIHGLWSLAYPRIPFPHILLDHGL